MTKLCRNMRKKGCLVQLKVNWVKFYRWNFANIMDSKLCPPISELIRFSIFILHKKNGLLKLRLFYLSAIYQMLIDFCLLLLNRIFLQEVGIFIKWIIHICLRKRSFWCFWNKYLDTLNIFLLQQSLSFRCLLFWNFSIPLKSITIRLYDIAIFSRLILSLQSQFN